MISVKKVWINPWDAGLVSLCMESENVESNFTKLKISEMDFPANPTPEHPKRHTISISLLGQEDINLIAQALDNFRSDK